MLSVKGLEVSIGGSRILRGAMIEVPERQVFCLMGRNGVGKTTTLKSIVGLLKPSTGRIELDGQDITRLSPEARARCGIGYVPQDREIFPQLTVEENLHIGRIAHGRKLNGQLDRVFSLFPILKDFLPRKGGMLSGGQQQQLAIGRALLTEPKLLILDEPTEGIQPNIIDQIGEAIKLLRRGGGHRDESALLAKISHSLKLLREQPNHPNSAQVEELHEAATAVLRNGIAGQPALFETLAQGMETLRRADHNGAILGEEIGSVLKLLRAEGRMSILLVEQYLDFCKELADTFAIMDRGAIVAHGAIAELTDEVVRSHLTV